MAFAAWRMLTGGKRVLPLHLWAYGWWTDEICRGWGAQRGFSPGWGLHDHCQLRQQLRGKSMLVLGARLRGDAYLAADVSHQGARERLPNMSHVLSPGGPRSGVLRIQST